MKTSLKSPSGRMISEIFKILSNIWNAVVGDGDGPEMEFVSVSVDIIGAVVGDGVNKP